MRHLKVGRSLSRSPAHRKALLSNLAQELFQHKRIRTTLTKARELRPFAEKLVTTAKKGHLAARRHVLRFLSRKAVVKSLFDDIAPQYAERNGGYTRIIKLDLRAGDSAPMAIVEMVGYEGVIAEKVKAAESKKAEKADKAAKKPGARPAKPAPEKKERKKAEGKGKPAAKAGRGKAPAATGKKAAKKSGEK
jgi:large subunit ribosomal protein L17